MFFFFQCLNANSETAYARVPPKKKENIMNPPYISSIVIDGLISTPTKVMAANIIDNIKNILIILISIS